MNVNMKKNKGYGNSGYGNNGGKRNKNSFFILHLGMLIKLRNDWFHFELIWYINPFFDFETMPNILKYQFYSIIVSINMA